jgi:hypothetical protein
VSSQPSVVSSILPAVFPRLGHDWRRRNSYLLLTALTLLCLLPFSGKPFQVDDPLFVWADSAHEAAEIIYHKAQNENTNVWFQGHWGFQYYMQLHGAHPIDYARTRLNAGDLGSFQKTASRPIK